MKLGSSESLCRKKKRKIKHDDEDDGSKKMRLAKEQLLQSLHLSDEEQEPSHHLLSQESSSLPQKEVHQKVENVSEEVDQAIKQLYRDRNKLVRNTPVLCLKEAGNEASLEVKEEERYPLVFPDIVDLLEHLQYNRHLTRWLQVKKATKLNNTIMLLVEGPGIEEFSSQLEDCPTLKSYRVGVEFASPLSYGESAESAIAAKLEVKPLPSQQLKQGFERMKSCVKKDGFVTGLDTLFNIRWDHKEDGEEIKTTDEHNHNGTEDKDQPGETEEDKEKQRQEFEEVYQRCLKSKQTLPVSLHAGDKFSRLDLVMTPRDMAYEKFPLPFLPRYRGFVKTKEEYQEVTEKSPMFGVDCEMCETARGSELTRISITNELHEVVYERLVKPYNKITNYVTKYSGITPKMLKGVVTRVADVQAELRELLPPDAILVGHSLNCDLNAMQMMHPYVIDTSTIFNLVGERHCKPKLKTLCAELLCESIQNSKKGHDSIEDALSALKLVQAKLQNYIEWGDAVLGFKLTAEDSCQANEILRSNASLNKKKPRLALNALVDDASKFDAAKHQRLINQRVLSSGGNSLGQAKAFKELSLNFNSIHGSVIMKKNGQAESDPTLNPVSNFIYSEVAVVGSKEVKKIYKTALSESALERVKLYKAKTSQDVINKVLELDAEPDKKRLIIAHAKSPCVCQVEKWSAKLKSKTKDNDVVLISLCGSRGNSSVRGAFFATVPLVDNLPPMKQVVLSYVASTTSSDPVDNGETHSNS